MGHVAGDPQVAPRLKLRQYDRVAHVSRRSHPAQKEDRGRVGRTSTPPERAPEPQRPIIDIRQTPHEIVADALAIGADVKVYPIAVGEESRWGVMLADVKYALADFASREQALSWCRSRGLPVV